VWKTELGTQNAKTVVTPFFRVTDANRVSEEEPPIGSMESGKKRGWQWRSAAAELTPRKHSYTQGEKQKRK